MRLYVTQSFRILPCLAILLPFTLGLTVTRAAQDDDVLSIQFDTRNEALGRLAADYLHAMQRDSAADLSRIMKSRLAPRVLELEGVEGWTRSHLYVAGQITTFEEAVVVEDAPLRLEILTSLTPEAGSDEPLEWAGQSHGR